MSATATKERETNLDGLAPGTALAERRKLKAENDSLRAENIRLKKQLDEAVLSSGLVNAIPRPVQPAVYCERIIPELQAMADQGATEAEWLAAWDISEDTWKEWCELTPCLKAEAARARTRARAVFEAVFRRALMAGDRAFPFAKWVDIMNQRYGADDAEAQGNSVTNIEPQRIRCEVCRDAMLED